jgi:hypothetical protein
VRASTAAAQAARCDSSGGSGHRAALSCRQACPLAPRGATLRTPPATHTRARAPSADARGHSRASTSTRA